MRANGVDYYVIAHATLTVESSVVGDYRRARENHRPSAAHYLSRRKDKGSLLHHQGDREKG